MQKRSTVSLPPSSFLATIYICVPIYLRLSPSPFVSIRLFASKELVERKGDRVRAAFYRITLNVSGAKLILRDNRNKDRNADMHIMQFATGGKYVYETEYKSRLKSSQVYVCDIQPAGLKVFVIKLAGLARFYSVSLLLHTF